MRYRIDIDNNLARSLKLCAEKTRTTVPELLRNAVQDSFPYDPIKRRECLSQIVGLWAPRPLRESPPMPKRFWPRNTPPPAVESPRGVLVDTGILSEVLRGHDRLLVEQWLHAVEHGTGLVCSTFSVAEIWRTAAYHEMPRLNKLCSAMLCLPVDSEVARTAGEITYRCERGRNLTMADALMAATAVLNQCEIWTRDPKRFPCEIVNYYRPSINSTGPR